MKAFRLAIYRHGLTRANLEGFYAGAGTDLPLAPEGEAGLRALAQKYEYPPAQAVFCSPLLRCAQSAELLFPGVKRIGVQDLRELHFGEFEGRRAEELTGDPHYRLWVDPRQQYTPEGGENGTVFAARTRGVLLKMFEYMMKSGITDAACVTHGGVIMSMLAQRALPQRPANLWACDPGCGYLVLCTPEMWMRDGLVEAQTIVPLGYGDECEPAGYTVLEDGEDAGAPKDGGKK